MYSGHYTYNNVVRGGGVPGVSKCGITHIHPETYLACSHHFCPTNLREYTLKEIRSGKSVFGVPCPKCQVPIDEIRMGMILGESQFRDFVRDQEEQAKRTKRALLVGEHERVRDNSPKLTCPKCKNESPHFVINDMASCTTEGCEYIYCMRCSRAGHEGFCQQEIGIESAPSDSAPPKKGKGKSITIIQQNEHQPLWEDVKPLHKTKIKEPTYQFYQDTKPEDSKMRNYEEEYYSQPGEREPKRDPNEITREKISEAFTHPQDMPWPWDLIEVRGQLEFCKTFESLAPKRWIEDELLERAIKTNMEKQWGSRGFVLLESYLFRWGMSHNNETFINAIQEKDLLSREVIVSLMNSDLSGSGGHWILGVVDCRASRIILLDSSRVDSISYYQNFFFYLLHALYVSSQLSQSPFDPNAWDLCILADASQQTNSYDCGAMALANLYALTTRRELNFSPDGVLLRQWIYKLLTTQKDMLEDNVVKGASPSKDSFRMPIFEPKNLRIKRTCQNCILPKMFEKASKDSGKFHQKVDLMELS